MLLFVGGELRAPEDLERPTLLITFMYMNCFITQVYKLCDGFREVFPIYWYGVDYWKRCYI